MELPVDLFVLQDLASADCMETAEAHSEVRTAVVIDQIVPPNAPAVSKLHKELIAFAKKTEVPFFYGRGMSAWQLCDGLVEPGQVVVSCDPTVTAVGAVGASGFCVSSNEMEKTMETGRLMIEAPACMTFVLEGELREESTVRDLAFHMIREMGADSCKGILLKVIGDGVKNLDQEERLMLAAALGKAGVLSLSFDEKPAREEGDWFCAINEVEPLAAMPGGCQDIRPVRELDYTKVNSVFIGGTAGGSLADIRLTAQLLKGRKIAYESRLIVAPATADIYVQAATAGYIAEILDAGGIVINQCGNPEVQGRIGADEVMVSNDLENRAGYAGFDTSRIFLTSTKTAVEAVIEGALAISKKKEEVKKAVEVKPLAFEGRCWKFGDDIDTDIIIPTQHLCYETMEEIKTHAFEPLRPELAAQLQEGDIIIGGSNFGCGSSREQAAEVIVENGVHCIVAKSFARIFFRNAINNGILLIECPELPDEVQEGDRIRVELDRQRILANGKEYHINAIAENLYHIIMDGGLVKSIMKRVEKGIL